MNWVDPQELKRQAVLSRWSETIGVTAGARGRHFHFARPRGYDEENATPAARLKVHARMLIDHDRRIEDLEQRIGSLEAPQQRVEEDPIQCWLRKNRSLIEANRGKHVAIHPEKGLVAAGPNYETVRDSVKAAGMTGQVVYDYFPQRPRVRR